MRPLFAVVVFLILTFAFLPRSVSASGWWDPAWEKRRQITLPSHPENWQVLVVLPFNDNSIRFLEDEDGGLLPYWVENCGENWMRVWVRRTENADSTIYVYYGNPSAGRADNGFDVFPFFDDFSTDNHIDWSRWGASGPVSATVSGGVMTVSGTQSTLQYVYGRTYLKYCTMRARLRAHSNANYMQVGLSDLPSQPGGLDTASLIYDGGWKWRTTRNDATWVEAISVNMTQWRTMQIDWSASQVTFRLDENVHTITANIPQDDMSAWFYVYSSPSGSYRAWEVDWVFVARGVVDGFVGEEETAPAPPPTLPLPTVYDITLGPYVGVIGQWFFEVLLWLSVAVVYFRTRSSVVAWAVLLVGSAVLASVLPSGPVRTLSFFFSVLSLSYILFRLFVRREA